MIWKYRNGFFLRCGGGNRGKVVLSCLVSCLFLGQAVAVQVQQADSLTLDQCYELAIAHSTLGKQAGLQQQITASGMKSTGSGYLPQAQINGQATYQSAVVTLPISMPGVEPLNKDQYKATLDLQQMVYDGGYISRQKKMLESNLLIEQNKLDITTLQLKDQVSGIYLGILLLDEQIRITEVYGKDLANNIEKLSSLLQNGVALKSNVDLLEAELLKAQQQEAGLHSDRRSLVRMLSVLVGKELPDRARLVMPRPEADINDPVSNRPEFRLFEARKSYLERQAALIDSKNLPKVSVFATGGNGRPGLNMLSNSFDWYYMVGAKLAIPLTNWTSTRHEKRTVVYQQSLVDEQKTDFTRQNRMDIIRQIGEIDKYRVLIGKDKAIIAKRKEIAATEEKKLLNGVSTSYDYVTQLNAESQAMLDQKLHEIQLIQAIVNYKSLTAGK